MFVDTSLSKDHGTATVGLTDQEECLVREILDYLEAENCAATDTARTRLSCLRDLAGVISRFPSIRNTQPALEELEGAAGSVKSILAFAAPPRLLRYPAKVAAVRSYLVAKFHAFSLLTVLTREKAEYHIRARSIVFSIVCALMIEEVYVSCLEDPSFPEPVRLRLAEDLLTFWDSGVDPRAVEHLFALEALWAARDAAPPSFGTMDGASELARITLDLGDDWHNFLVDSISNDEIRFALEEFLFGISYEEIIKVRSRLGRPGVSAVNAEEVRACLGNDGSYARVNNEDPRMVYDFYADRRDAALLRRQTNAPGPKRTLEEIYLKHRIVMELPE
jgi:hypothetical protein